MVFISSQDQGRQSLDGLVDESLRLDDINLTNCDREPIHLSNAIQPHGLLVTFNSQTLDIIQVSANIEAWTHHPLSSLKGKTLAALFSADQIQIILQHLSDASNAQGMKPLQISLARKDGSHLPGYGLLHSGDAHSVIEIEAISGQLNLDYAYFYDLIKAPIERLQRTQILAELCDAAVHEIQKITGFDRVMVYRFHPDGSGSVIAEAAGADAVPYLGLRYPSTDIPRQAKQLYTINWLRIIPDVEYEPVPLLNCQAASDEYTLDMSHMGLRSVSPIHVEYLKNMGVQASLSISLLHEGKLWGLIACHHQSSKLIELPIRTSCEFIGQIISSELVAKERYEILHRRAAQKAVLNRLEKAILSSPELTDSFRGDSEALLSFVDATGAAYIENGKVTLFGETPTRPQVVDLIAQLKPQFQDNAVYATPCLSQLIPEAHTYSSQASGVLGLAISQAQDIYLLWFRPELPQLVNWAGNPHKPSSLDENGQLYLSPRKSFERWVETVLLSCEPWGPAEIENALELRSSIIGLVLQKADELAKVNLELARSNEDLASFAYVASHDLKAPLRAIANLACWIQEDLEGTVSEETQAQLDLLTSRVYRMHDMIQGLLQYSRVGDHANAVGVVSLPDLLDEILDSLAPPASIQIDQPKITTLYETNKVLLKQVLTNLLSNAIKYINRTDGGRIGIQIEEADEGLCFAITDNGPGIAPEYHDKIFQMFQTLQSRDDIESTGIGLAIVKKVITTQGGSLQVYSNVDEGSTFAFTWPNASPLERR